MQKHTVRNILYIDSNKGIAACVWNMSDRKLVMHGACCLSEPMQCPIKSKTIIYFR